MNEQTKQKIIEAAKNWVDEIYGESRKFYTNAKLRESVYFVGQLRDYVGKLAFDYDDYTTADESEIINAVLA